MPQPVTLMRGPLRSKPNALAAAKLLDPFHLSIAGFTGLHPLRRSGMHVRTNVILHERGKALAQALTVSDSAECQISWAVLEPGLRPCHFTLFVDALSYMRPPPPAVIARKQSRRVQSAAGLARRKTP